MYSHRSERLYKASNSVTHQDQSTIATHSSATEEANQEGAAVSARETWKVFPQKNLHFRINMKKTLNLFVFFCACAIFTVTLDTQIRI